MARCFFSSSPVNFINGECARCGPLLQCARAPPSCYSTRCLRWCQVQARPLGPAGPLDPNLQH